MILYHGTVSKEEIIESGFNTDWVFLAARKDVAEDYGFDVVEVSVSDDDLLVDLDVAGAIGVTVESANAMTGNEYETAAEYAENGYSVCVLASSVLSVK